MLLLPSQIQSLAAGFICMLIYGSSYTYGTLIPYVTSYIYYENDNSITANKMASLLVISILVLNVGMPLCNIKQLQFSNRVTSFISIVGICSCILAISFGSSFEAYLILYGIFFGLFIGFGYLAPIKNCYQHIPQLKGLCSGVCILGYGISSLLFNFILVALINPNNQPAHLLEDGSGRKIYSKDVAENVPFALRIMSVIYLAIGLIGIALMNPPTPAPLLLENVKEEQYESQISSASEPLLSQKPLDFRQLISYIIKKNILWLVLTLSTSIPFGMFIAFNYKEYGMQKIDDDSFLTIVGSCGAVFNGAGRFFWGFMLDKFSFRVISAVINGVLLVGGLSISLLVQNEYLFLIGVAVIYFCYGGNYSIYPTHTVRVFGQDLGGKVYYLVFTGFSFGCLIQWLSRLIIVPDTPQEAKFNGFRTCFFIFAGLNLLALILSIFVKYEDEQSKHQQAQ